MGDIKLWFNINSNYEYVEVNNVFFLANNIEENLLNILHITYSVISENKFT